MNKKILISLSLIAAVAAIAIGVTTALFSDTETSTGNTISAGTLDLMVDQSNGQNVVKFTVINVKPGDSGTGTWTLNNVGSLNGYLDLESIAFTDDDNNCNEPEAAVPDVSCGPTGGGELSANLNVDLFVDANNNSVNDSGDTPIYNGLLSGIAASYDLNLALNSAATNYITLNWSVDPLVGNIIQSDGVTFGMTFELGQDTAQ